LAKINKKIYSSYSLGKILCFDLDGNIDWQIDFKDIIKTPIKIHNDNILVLLTNKIVLLDSINGEIIKEFIYENNINQFNSSGGNLVSFNQFLFFILPNNEMGEIDTIFGEKNNSMFLDIPLNNKINNFDRKLHVFNNFLFLLDQNKFLSVLDINTNEIILNQLIIDNIGSSYFINNSIFTLKKDGFLYAYNLVNNKLFWSIDLSKLIKDDDQIINISTYLNSIIIFFKDGKIIELNSVNGNIMHNEDLKLDNIKSIQYLDKYLIVDQLSGKTSIFTK
jgi:outer membrane protein assembly factor BamB